MIRYLVGFFLFFVIVSCFDFKDFKRDGDSTISSSSDTKIYTKIAELEDKIKQLEKENNELKMKLDSINFSNDNKVYTDEKNVENEELENERYNEIKKDKYQNNLEENNLPFIYLKSIDFFPVNTLWKFQKDKFYYQVRIPNRIKYISFQAIGISGDEVICYSLNGNKYKTIPNGSVIKNIYVNTGVNNLYIKVSKKNHQDTYYKISIIRYEDADLKNVVLQNAVLKGQINLNQGNYTIYSKDNTFIAKFIKQDNKSKFYIKSDNIKIIDNNDKTFSFIMKIDRGRFVLTMMAIDGYKRYYTFDVIVNKDIGIGKGNQNIIIDSGINDKITTTNDEKDNKNKITIDTKTKSDIILTNFSVNSLKNYEYELELSPKFIIDNYNYQLVINKNVIQIGLIFQFDAENGGQIKVNYNGNNYFARNNKLQKIDLVDDVNEVKFYVNEKEYKINISYLY